MDISSHPFTPSNILGMGDNEGTSWWLDVPQMNFYCLTRTHDEYKWTTLSGRVEKWADDVSGLLTRFWVPGERHQSGLPRNWWSRAQTEPFVFKGKMEVPDQNPDREPWGLKAAVICRQGPDEPAVVLHFQKVLLASYRGNTNDLHLVRCHGVPEQVLQKFYETVGGGRARGLPGPMYNKWLEEQGRWAERHRAHGEGRGVIPHWYGRYRR